MAKKTKALTEENVRATEDEVEGAVAGNQMDLIDVGPENLKEIEPHVKKLDAARTQRIKLTRVEHDEEEKIKKLVHKSGLKRLDDGNIKFMCCGKEVWVIPTDEKVKLKKPSKDELNIKSAYQAHYRAVSRQIMRNM